ncbi:MAG: hypothetical protein D8M57_05920 [Candidatus Scalindua sp. AMX11]|nr:MAG: hypothetical protein DWQ00_12870 [Candidatus Scalindua sp.]NOG82876.1 hypothetical protein [Planctomycetota bacterium]RZV86219.1 MAG: hypothetical protein EX341_07585 [Candidatus Scalindua sp. SCAELEC01]TDE65840.1 MAG: hypothetical protein D8M57_05920 [Candidatus Scalindua sp. AMX11]GJQ58347.1 MAG: hypothetical protein SCALA701_11480 [Candidatus Scalindua sp.]
MNKEVSKLLDEAIKLERNVADLYTIFNKLFPEDADFWSTLASEERNHAALLNSGKKTLLAVGMFPSELLVPQVQRIIDANSNLISLINNYGKAPPSRERAFNDALFLEQSAGEIHFQQAMKRVHSSDIMQTFQQLNKDDRDHILRIRNYMKEKEIKIHSHSMKQTQKNEQSL